MIGIQFVTDQKDRKVGVITDLKKHGAIWEDFWDGLVSRTRRVGRSRSVSCRPEAGNLSRKHPDLLVEKTQELQRSVAHASR